MVVFPKKRIYGLISMPRGGKDTVANYLKETRDFVTMAFADQIKDEFGISKSDFEAAKIAGNIEILRKKLWEFSAQKKEIDPMYFIKKVMDNAIDSKNSTVITDIRTVEEMSAFFNYRKDNCLRRIYLIHNTAYENDDKDGFIIGTKISANIDRDYSKYADEFRTILNTNDGLFDFLCALDKFFFAEDVVDLLPANVDKFRWRSSVSDYLDQFDIKRTTT